MYFYDYNVEDSAQNGCGKGRYAPDEETIPEQDKIMLSGLLPESPDQKRKKR